MFSLCAIELMMMIMIGMMNHNTKFQRNRLITFAVILLTDRQDERVTDRHTALIA